MASKDHALHRDSMADRVKQDLLHRIMSGELSPGTRLIELQIARELNTSQGPVREALCELEGLELVVTEPYKGTRVREVTPQDIREAYMVRAVLENLVGQLAAPHFEGSVDRTEEGSHRDPRRSCEEGRCSLHSPGHELSSPDRRRCMQPHPAAHLELAGL